MCQSHLKVCVVGSVLIATAMLIACAEPPPSIESSTTLSPAGTVTPTNVHTTLAAALPNVTPSSQVVSVQPYKATEFLIANSSNTLEPPAANGSWVVWRIQNSAKPVFIHDLTTGKDAMLMTENFIDQWSLGDNMIVTVEVAREGQMGIFGYRLPDLSRFTIVPLEGDRTLALTSPAISGNFVAWIAVRHGSSKSSPTTWNIYVHNLVSNKTFPIAVLSNAYPSHLVVSGNWVVWLDQRDTAAWNLYGYDLSTAREFNIASSPIMTPHRPAISGNTVIWWTSSNGIVRIMGYDLVTRQERIITDLGRDNTVQGVDIGGDLMVECHRNRGLGYFRLRSEAASPIRHQPRGWRSSGAAYFWKRRRLARLAPYGCASICLQQRNLWRSTRSQSRPATASYRRARCCRRKNRDCLAPKWRSRYTG